MGARHQWLTPVILATSRLTLGGWRFEASPGKQFYRPHLQNNQSKMDWGCGSSSRAPALQVQSLEFKPQSQERKKERKEGRKGRRKGGREGVRERGREKERKKEKKRKRQPY
jgi:hypothetical protein